MDGWRDDAIETLREIAATLRADDTRLRAFLRRARSVEAELALGLEILTSMADDEERALQAA